MSAGAASLLGATLPRWAVLTWCIGLLVLSVTGHLVLVYRLRRFMRLTEARVEGLRRRLAEHHDQVDARIDKLSADVDAHKVWHDASARFLHHGLVAISYRFHQQAASGVRSCVTEHRQARSRPVSSSLSRPKKAAAPTSPTSRTRRSNCR